jgi:hypothetical protein
MGLIVPSVAIFTAADGRLVLIGPAETKPRDGQGWTPLPTGYSDRTHSWDAATRMMVEDAAKVEAMLIGKVKTKAADMKTVPLSTYPFKDSEYAEKRNEVILWDSLGGTVAAILMAFDALPAGRRATRFAHTLASSAIFGDKPADAIERFRSGIAKSVMAPSVSAIEEKACVTIRAAKTAAAKRAAYAAINWDVKP